MIPRNWRLIKQSDVCKLDNGQKLSDISFPYIDVKYLRGISKAKMVYSGNYVEKNSLIILVDGENSGEVFIVPENGYMGSTFRLLKFDDSVNTKFLRYFIETKKEIYKTNKQGSAIPHLNKKLFNEMLFPLPPLDEQQRIVDIIENLFSKLDRAKALTQNVIDNYELRRSAILHKAFTGELIKYNFQRMIINSICKSLTYGTSKKSSKFDKTAVIRMGNLQNGEIDWSNLAYSNDDEEIEKYNLSAGDVLFNRTNSAELVGKTSIYRGEYPAIYAGYLIKLDYDHNILIGDYFNYMLNAPEAKDYCQRVKTDGVNQSNINAKKIGAFEIPIPNLENQKELVRILDSLLDKEQRTKELAEQVLQKIDLMKKSILARAFRGELGTNEPNEKIAEDFLVR